MKICNKCKVEKNLKEFGKDSRKNDGHKYMCKLCHNASNNALRKANPESYRTVNRLYAQSPRGKALQRAGSLRRKYWPTLTGEEAIQQYDKLLIEQKHCCAICGLHQSMLRVTLAVDHNKLTGKVRGLLCNKCNRFEVGRHTLATAAQLLAYLKKHDGID